MDELKVATVFSGVGAFEQALIKKNINHKIIFACDNGERVLDDASLEEVISAIKSGCTTKQKNSLINKAYNKTKKINYVKKSYLSNYAIEKNRWFEDIRFITKKDIDEDIDIFVGGSPCQSFSNIGKRGGLDDVRGTLFYEYARLVQELKPRVFIYENVPGMLNHDKGKTWETIKKVFESLNYQIYYSVLNSIDYKIPQNRKRLFVVGFLDKNVKFEFPKPQHLDTTMFDYLDDKVDPRYYLGEKGFKFVTSNTGRARVNRNIIQTQKANQQFNWNGDFVFVPYKKVLNDKKIMERAYVGVWNGKKGVCRQLSHRECFRLMGFPDSFKIVVPNVHAYRQAGNSIVVNILEALLSSIINTGVFNEKT